MEPDFVFEIGRALNIKFTVYIYVMYFSLDLNDRKDYHTLSMIDKTDISVKKNLFPGTGQVLIYPCFEKYSFKGDNKANLLKKISQKIDTKLSRRQFEGKEEQMVLIDGENHYEAVLFLGMGKKEELSMAQCQKLLINALTKLKEKGLTEVNLFHFKELGEDFFAIGEMLAVSLSTANYQFLKHKGKEERKTLNKIISNFKFQISPTLQSESDQKRRTKIQSKIKKIEEGIEFGKIVSDGINLCRDLVNEPGSHIYPETLEQIAFQIEKESKGKVKVEVLDEDECRRLGMGAFLGVAQGSERKPKFIILHYQGNKATRQQGNKKICLIGKSITFDSGGISLKPSKGMEEMKIDMAGGAIVLGVFKILAELHGSEIPTELHGKEIYGILPACENMPSGKALKPGDVVMTMNGKTVEVITTDAEGRMILADAISYAEKYLKPKIIIDIATLTGACMVALGKKIAGAFSNKQSLIDSILRLAKNTGEEIWPMPLYKPYLKDMKSEIADIKNVSGTGLAGAITGALFLSEFVTKTDWLHLDVAGPVFDKQATGWGVKTLVDFVVK